MPLVAAVPTPCCAYRADSGLISKEVPAAWARGMAATLALIHSVRYDPASMGFLIDDNNIGSSARPSSESRKAGCAERFVRTLKEQLLWLKTFETTEESRLALQEFKDRYNREWLIARNGYLTPEQVRARLLPAQGEAA